ncbi:MAG: YHS domain-containing protein [Rhodospirillales bacterium]|nr:YHS domain-containing protein [Rhodospirillales bacterium]
MMTTDPVCGMKLDSAKAAGSETWQGRMFFFCSDQCHRTFVADPVRYARPAAAEPDEGGGTAGRGKPA